MKKYIKKIMIILLCFELLSGLNLFPMTSTYVAGTETSDSEILQERNKARNKIDDYANIKKADATKAIQESIDKVVNRYKSKIGSAQKIEKDDKGKTIGLTDSEMISLCVETAKGKIDDVIEGKSEEVDNNKTDRDDDDKPIGPSSSSDFILVGGDWVVPVVSYGQSVNIVLPVVNMGTENLKDVLITPVVGNTVAEWPFILEKDNYTQTIPDLPGKLNGQNDMDRRRELTWTLRARDDAKSGYYKLQFNVLYYVGAETESCTLTTYVHVLGAAGSGSIESEGSGTSTPRVIVTGFSTEPAKVYAGDTFKLTIHLKNTSQRTDVSNMLVTVSAPSEGADSDSTYAAFLPTSGSNSSYVSKISKGATYDLTIELSAKKDLSQKPYQLDVNMEFEDEEYSSFTSNADVSIPIHQDAKFELNTPEVLPDTISVGQESNVMFSIYNTGRLPLVNVKLSFEGGCVTGGEAYLGKVDAGGTGNVDVMVTGAAATTGEDSVVAVLTYEDETGEQKTFKQPIKLTITGEQAFDDSFAMDDFGEVDYEEDIQGSKKPIIWIIVGSLVGIIVIIVIIVVIVKIGKRKKEEKEMSSLLSDLEGEKDTDEIS